MKPLRLKKLISKRKLETLVASFGEILSAPLCVLDELGKPFYGRQDIPYQVERALKIKGHQVGLVRGGDGLQAFTEMLSVLLDSEYEKRALAAETLHSYSELNLLYKVAREFSVTMQLEDVGRIFVESAQMTIPGDGASLMLYNKQSDHLELLYSSRERDGGCLRLRPGEGIGGQVFQAGAPEIVNDIQDDMRYVEGSGPIRSLICAPLTTGQKVIGIISLHALEPNVYTARDLNLLYTLASHAATAIENAKLYKKLQLSEEEYRSLYENAVEGIFRCSSDNRILGVNPSMARILRYDSPQELITQVKDLSTDCFVEAEKAGEFWQAMERSQAVSGFETRFYTKDKDIIWVSINATMVKGRRGETEHIDGSIIEVTERIKREKAEWEKELILHQSNEYKQLVHVLCHDLANPLGSLKINLTILASNVSRFKELSQYLMPAVDNSISIIDMVRRRSAVAENKVDLLLEKYNLKSMIDESILVLFRRFESKNIVPENRVKSDHFVLVDKVSFINTVINNLFSNAIKFSYPGDKVFVDSREKDGVVTLSIRDRGIGIPPEILQSVFDPSQKTSREGTHGETGVGFGMPLVKTFITAYGGTISITSTPESKLSEEHGTEVRIQLQSA